MPQRDTQKDRGHAAALRTPPESSLTRSDLQSEA